MRSEHHVLTPESVEFVYELGGLGTRMVAVLLDHLVVFALLLALWMVTCIGAGPLLVDDASRGTGTAILGLAFMGTFLLYFGYFTYFEWKWNGQTPGKRYMDLRVIDDRGMNIDLFQALMRNLFRVVDMAPFLRQLDFIAIGLYGIGAGTALLNPRQKRLGDWAAGTLVVRTRKRVMPGAIIAPNEKYNTLQEDGALRARIRRDLSLEERETLLQLCMRRNELEFESRRALFADAAAYLENKLEVQREAFLSEEKFVQNIAAVALAESGGGGRGT
jgi:uncharacterized RDD family membrane protein YckC